MNWKLLGIVLEVAGGARPLPEGAQRTAGVAIARAIWWLTLLALAAAFAGRNTKFVYVDF